MRGRNLEISVNKGLRLDIQIEAFALEVNSSELKDVVTIDIQVGNDDVLEKFFDINYHKEKNILYLKEKTQGDNKQKREALLKLTVPIETSITAFTENRTIVINGLIGEHKVMSKNGRIDLSNCNGQVFIESKNGSLVITKTSGIVNLESKNGHIDVNHGEGTLLIKAVNGSVRCSKVNYDKSEAFSKNGSIYYEVPMKKKGSYSFYNKNGSIRIFIPSELPYNISAKNENGRYNFSLASNYEVYEEGHKKYLKSVKGIGKVLIHPENINGSISLFSERKQQILTNRGQKINISRVNKEELSDHISRRGEDNISMNSGDMHKDRKTNSYDNHFSELLAKKRKTPEDDGLTDVSVNEGAVIINKYQNKELIMEILQMLEQGNITIDEADRLVSAIPKKEEKNG